MTGITIPFDPIGYFTDNPVGSRIISLKDTMMYNFLKNLTITQEQIHTYLNTGQFNYNTEQQDAIKHRLTYLIKYLEKSTIEDVSNDLNNYVFTFNNKKYKMFSYTDDIVNRLTKLGAPQYTIHNLKNNMGIVYREFTKYFFNDYKYRHNVLMALYNMEGLIPKVGENFNQNQVNLITECIKHGFDYMDMFSMCIDHWINQFYNELNCQIYEAGEMVKFEMQYVGKDNKIIDYTKVLSLAAFKDLVIRKHMGPSFRQRYFMQNLYNIRIFTAKIGGYSLLQWYGTVMFDMKKDEVLNKDILDFMSSSWAQYYVDCGYVIDEQFNDYIKEMMITELKYLPMRIQQEELMMENARLRTEIEHVKKEVKEIQDKKKKVENELTKTKNTIDNLKQANNTYEGRIQTLQNENAAYATEIKNMNAEIASTRALKEQLDADLLELTNKKETYIADKAKLQAHIDIVQTNNTELQALVSRLQQDKFNLQNDLNIVNNNIAETNQQIIDLENENTRLSGDVERLTKLNEKLQTQLKSAQNELAEVKEKLQIQINSPSADETKIKKLLEKQKNINANYINEVKKQLNKFNQLIPYEYNPSKSLNDNIEYIGSAIGDIIAEKKQQISENEKQISDYMIQNNQLLTDKANITNKLNVIKRKLKKSQQDLNAKTSLLKQLGVVQDAITTKIDDFSKEEEGIRKERETLNQLIDKYKESIDNYYKMTKRNEDSIREYQRIIDENKKKEKELEESMQILRQHYAEYEKKENDLIDREKALENRRKKIEDKLAKREDRIKQQIEELNKKINTTLKEMAEFIPHGVDAVEGKLIAIIYKMAVNPNMSIKGFRDLFISEIQKQQINVVIPQQIIDNSEMIYRKSIYRWFMMYQQRLKNLAGKDFNPEGILFDTVRNEETKLASKHLNKLLKSNDLYNYEDFKRMLIHIGIKDEHQKAYFYARLNHEKIGDAVIGNKSIDEWFAAYLTHFFGGYKGKYEKDRFI